MDTLIQQVRKYTIGNENIVAIYFSASYCKWCTTFTPQLRSVYPYFNEYGIKIVLAGSDKTEDSYAEYANQQIWPVMSFDDSSRMELRKHLNIKTIPALVFVSADGQLIDMNGRNLVVKALEESYGPIDAAKAIAIEVGAATHNMDYDSDDSDF